MFRYGIIDYGGIAQLGERLTGSQEVSGSIPLISTKKGPKPQGFRPFPFSNTEKKKEM